MDVFSVWQTVGGGTVDDPFYKTYLPVNIQGQARLLLGGITCFGADGNKYAAEDAHAALESAEIIYDNAMHSSHIVHLVCTPELSQLFDDWLYGHYFYDYNLSDLRGFVSATLETTEARLSAWRPNLYTGDPIEAAIEVIATVNDGSDIGTTVFDYYQKVIDPNLPTPTSAPNLLRPDGFDISLANYYNGSDSLGRAVRVGDLGFQAITCHEVLADLDNI